VLGLAASVALAALVFRLLPSSAVREPPRAAARAPARLEVRARPEHGVALAPQPSAERVEPVASAPTPLAASASAPKPTLGPPRQRVAGAPTLRGAALVQPAQRSAPPAIASERPLGR
jgi:hypothetical protein